MTQRKRNIACLESLWDDKTENRLGVIPMLEIIAKNWEIKFSHLTCNTEEELNYNFGSCSTLRDQNEVSDFVKTTGVSMVTGFTNIVDWIESAAFELLLFQNFQNYKSPKVACKRLLQKYPDLTEITGFKTFPEIIL